MLVRSKLILIAALGLCSISPRAAAEPRFAVGDDGGSIVDRQTRLVWSRCAAGMTWRSGTCSGEAVFATYQEASNLAKSQADGDGVPWRLPTMTELKTLADGLRSVGARSAVLLPAAP